MGCGTRLAFSTGMKGLAVAVAALTLRATALALVIAALTIGGLTIAASLSAVDAAPAPATDLVLK
jgi:hypothetical protein